MNKKKIFDRMEVECPNCKYKDVPRSPLDDSGSHYCFECDMAFDPRITELTEDSFEMLHLVMMQIVDAYAAENDTSKLIRQAAMLYLEAVENEYPGTIASG